MLLFGELESTELSERPLVSEGEASNEVFAEKMGPLSKLVTGRIEAMRLGVALEPFGTEVEGRFSATGDCWSLVSWNIVLSRFRAFVVAGDTELRLGLGGLDKSSEARLEATESAVPGRLEDSLLRVSLLDLDMSFLMTGKKCGVVV